MRTKKWTAEVDGQYLEIVIQDVTPKMATDMLKKNKRNRKPKKSLISTLSTDMGENMFRFNGDTVRFDSRGTLMDGQHRLLALVASGATVPMMIIRGFDPDVMDTVDQGVTRTVLDILATHGVMTSNLSVIASAATILVLGDRALSEHTRDRKLVASFVEKDLDVLNETCSWAKRVSNASPLSEVGQTTKQKSLSPSPLAALRIHMARAGADDENVVTYFEKLSTLRPADDPTEHESLRMMRSWLAKTRPLVRDGGSSFPRMMSVYQMLIWAYNRIERGEAVERIRPGKDEPTYKYFDELLIPEH